MSTRITRGTTVLFAATFTDVNGVNAVPTGAHVRLYYLNRGVANVEVVDMTLSGITYQGEWVADDPDIGPMSWHVYTDDAFPTAVDGKLIIAANDANPQSNT